MTFKDLVRSFALHTSCPLTKAEMYVRSLQTVMERELLEGGYVSFPNFIILRTVKTPARSVKYSLPNGKSGTMNIPQKRRVKVSTSKNYKAML